MSRLTDKLSRDANLIDNFRKIAANNEFKVFEQKGTILHNFNLWGVRAYDEQAGIYDDAFIIFWNEKLGVVSDWKYIIIEGTTDPSDNNLLKPINPKGCMILPEGQYLSLFKIGKHKNDYEALVQNTTVGVYRDNNKDTRLDYTGDLDIGWFGLNFHHASKFTITDRIGLYSAGCQVIKSINDWNTHIRDFLIAKMKAEGQKTISYTLIHEREYDFVR